MKKFFTLDNFISILIGTLIALGINLIRQLFLNNRILSIILFVIEIGILFYFYFILKKPGTKILYSYSNALSKSKNLTPIDKKESDEIPNIKKDLFLCYDINDKEKIEPFLNTLKDSGYSVIEITQPSLSQEIISSSFNPVIIPFISSNFLENPDNLTLFRNNRHIYKISVFLENVYLPTIFEKELIGYPHLAGFQINPEELSTFLNFQFI